ncbi:putative high mobility group protein b1 [Toxoplasma gondii TgCatPRC2]|uniref:Putative high mobility group protein b1 n=1 Tax=Toxoplasma gondii TgCatPRC2 TaxID=1130821 RepID=A0A151HG43_TOXGO|nr:putative high mobility group protein b1 [Toxoplasma gondii TgCatPRC2]
MGDGSSDSDVPLKKRRMKSEPQREEDEDSEDAMPLKKRRTTAKNQRPSKTVQEEEVSTSEDDNDDSDHEEKPAKKKARGKVPKSPATKKIAAKGQASAARPKAKRRATKSPSTETKSRSRTTAAGTKRSCGGGARGKKENKDEGEEEEDIPNDARKYFKDGQKHITPPNGEGTRAFYESLYEENPNSLIALRYVIEYGVLTGTKLHESLPKYALLRELGAFKGAGGGVQPEFKDGLNEQQNKAARKALEAKGWAGLKKK